MHWTQGIQNAWDRTIICDIMTSNESDVNIANTDFQLHAGIVLMWATCDQTWDCEEL